MKELRTEQELALMSDPAQTTALQETPLTAADRKNLFLLCRNLQSQALCFLPAPEASEGQRQGLVIVMRDNTGAALGLPLVQGG